jgi:ComF family protein
MVNNWLDLLLPASCLLCGGRGDAAGLCAGCRADLPRLENPCPRCALPLPAASIACGECLGKPPPWSRCIAPLLYRPPVSALVAALKYRGRLGAGHLLTTLLAEQLRNEEAHADLLLPVPLHWRRRLRRGFNQAELIADQLGRELALPVAMRLLRRDRATAAQQSLDATSRRRNLRRAFTLRGEVVGLHVALIDDVVTTGATAAELSRLLLSAGAASVQVWSLARTPP